MYSKTHFKSLFKSPKISTVNVKNIFFLNTTLPKEHYTIIAQFLKLPNWRYKNHKTIQNLESNDLSYLLLSLTGGTRRSEDPTCHRPETGQLRCATVARPKLTDGELAGGDIITR